MLIAQAICQGHLLHDSHIATRVELKLCGGLLADFLQSCDNRMYQRYDIIKEMGLPDTHSQEPFVVCIDNMDVEVIFVRHQDGVLVYRVLRPPTVAWLVVNEHPQRAFA